MFCGFVRERIKRVQTNIQMRDNHFGCKPTFLANFWQILLRSFSFFQTHTHKDNHIRNVCEIRTHIEYARCSMLCYNRVLLCAWNGYVMLDYKQKYYNLISSPTLWAWQRLRACQADFVPLKPRQNAGSRTIYTHNTDAQPEFDSPFFSLVIIMMCFLIVVSFCQIERK